MSPESLHEFATKYTEAWCSQDPSRVAGFFAERGSLKINEAPPAVGQAAITSDARAFMDAFPDMVVRMDEVNIVNIEGDRAIFRWTLIGTNTGPGGTGMPVQISGYEEWMIGPDGLIAESKGHFDEAEYNRQLKSGFGER